MTEACDICGSEDFAHWLELSLCGVYDAHVDRCSACGFRQVRPRLSMGEISALYPPAYFDPESPIGFRDYARQQQRHEREAIWLARRLESISSRGRLLEVGCALGFLMDAVRRRTSWEVTGIDIAPSAARFAIESYGLDVRCGTLEEAGFADAQFDFIVQKDVLEHVADPRRHLAETWRVLKPEGRVLIVTPNGEANLRPLLDLSEKTDGSLLPLLTQGHLSFFGRRHLLRLFEECGFTCLGARSIGIRRGLRALGYSPRKMRGLQTVPRGKPSPTGGPDPPLEAAPNAGTDADTEPDIDVICERLEKEVRKRQTGWRTSLAYARFRRAMELLDRLPAKVPLGNDFEFLLKKGP